MTFEPGAKLGHLRSSSASGRVGWERANGRVTLLGYNDTGHLPRDLITSVNGPLARAKR